MVRVPAWVLQHWVTRRLYQDFMMGSRLEVWRALLECAVTHGYRVLSVADWADRVTQRPADPAGSERLLIVQNDVDTDPATAVAMARIQIELGVGGSFFFRLSTFDVGLVKQVDKLGCHVGYHYEEVATFAKRFRVHDGALARSYFGAIGLEFTKNIDRLRSASGLPLDIVASHGDWKNRQLDLSNDELLHDGSLRCCAGIRFETYDVALTGGVAVRSTDSTQRGWWAPVDPVPVLQRGVSPVSLLVHTRYWRSNPSVNARDNLLRIKEGLADRRRPYPLPLLPPLGQWLPAAPMATLELASSE